jgi:hypothetical protein
MEAPPSLCRAHGGGEYDRGGGGGAAEDASTDPPSGVAVAKAVLSAVAAAIAAASFSACKCANSAMATCVENKKKKWGAGRDKYMTCASCHVLTFRWSFLS